MLIGGLSAIRGVLSRERWCLHAFYGVYGGNESQKFWGLGEDFGGD